MLRIVLDYHACIAENCSGCPARASCDTRAIVKIDPDEPAAIDHTLCTGCGECVSICPAKALALLDE